MASITRTADYGGVGQGLYIPDSATDIVISEATRCSVLQHIVNQEYDIDNLGLNCAQQAHYHILTDIEIGDFTDGQWNGEEWEPDDPFRSGTIKMCQQVKIKKKFSRDEAIAHCSRWEGMIQTGYESSIANSLTRHTERYGFAMLVASAHKLNTGNRAGAVSGNIQLGDTVNPVNVGKGGLSAMDLLSLMEQTIQENGSTCGGNQLKVVVNPAFLNKIRSEQSALGAGCCLASNPMISGITHPVLGMDIYSTLNLPSYKRPDGKTVNYVLMVNPKHIAAPISLDYLEWDKNLNDIYLLGNYRFDVAALTNKSIAVAAVITD